MSHLPTHPLTQSIILSGYNIYLSCSLYARQLPLALHTNLSNFGHVTCIKNSRSTGSNFFPNATLWTLKGTIWLLPSTGSYSLCTAQHASINLKDLCKSTFGVREMSTRPRTWCSVPVACASTYGRNANSAFYLLPPHSLSRDVRVYKAQSTAQNYESYRGNTVYREIYLIPQPCCLLPRRTSVQR